MAATIKTLIEKADAAHKVIVDEDKKFSGAYDAFQAKLEDLGKRRDEINIQIDRIEDVFFAIENRDEYDLANALERLKQIA